MKRSQNVRSSIGCLAALMTAGCDPSHHDHGHSHHTDPPHGSGQGRQERSAPAHGHGAEGSDLGSITVTRWQSGYEWFLEYSLPVAGIHTHFLLHLTRLNDFAPETEALLTITFSGPAEMPAMEIAAPVRPGIYETEPVFPEAGTWTVQFAVGDADNTHTLKLPDVRVYESEEEALNAEGSAKREGVSYLKEQQWGISFETVSVKKQSLFERWPVTGRLFWNPNSVTEIHAPFTGQAKLFKENEPLLGRQVEAGEELFRFHPLEGSAAKEWGAAKERLEEARRSEAIWRKRYERASGLTETGVQSRSELEQVEMAWKQAKSELAEAEALAKGWGGESAFQDGALVFRSPQDGTVLEVHSSFQHTVVPEGEPLVRIVNSGSMHLTARVPVAWSQKVLKEAEFLAHPAGDDAESLLLNNSSHPLLVGGRETEPQSRTVPWTFEIPSSPESWIAGRQVTVWVPVGQHEDVVAIPASALVDEGGQWVIFVQVSGETFEKRTVQPGIRSRSLVSIPDGLRPGERVVSRGAYLIRLSSLGASMPAHGHAH